MWSEPNWGLRPTNRDGQIPKSCFINDSSWYWHMLIGRQWSRKVFLAQCSEWMLGLWKNNFLKFRTHIISRKPCIFPFFPCLSLGKNAHSVCSHDITVLTCIDGTHHTECLLSISLLGCQLPKGAMSIISMH